MTDDDFVIIIGKFAEEKLTLEMWDDSLHLTVEDFAGTYDNPKNSASITLLPKQIAELKKWLNQRDK
jgi:hypothetical protein